MRVEEIGFRIRQARIARGLTQAQLAGTAGLSRVTLNQIENGIAPDLGIRKVIKLLREVGLELAVHATGSIDDSGFIRMACITASVSYRESLSEDELIRALLTGTAPANRRPHLHTLFHEAPPELLRGVVEEMSRWTRPGRVEKNLAKVRAAVDGAP